jgi:ABC-type transport system involved in multi-copper enzyme maturation permease subunit
MKVIDIAFKDMLRSMRSAMGLVFMFVVPLLVTGMFYLMFGNLASEGGFSLPPITLVVANLDQNAPRLETSSKNTPSGVKANTLAGLVVEILRSEDLSDLLNVTLVGDAATARGAVDAGQSQVAVIIPSGFGEKFADPYGDQAQIEFYQDPTLTIGPEVVRSLMNQFMDSLAGIKIAVDLAVDELSQEEQAQIGRVVQEYMDSASMQSEDLSDTLLEVRAPNAAPQQEDSLSRIVGPIMGGMMIFYAFYTGTASAQSILREEEERTLPRLFTTPTPQATILTGKFLAVFLTVLVQIVVLLGVARLVFGVRWGDLTSLAVLVVGTVVGAASFGIFVNSLLKDTKQGGVVFGGLLTVTGMVGMIRIFGLTSASSTASAINTVSLLAPQGWAVRGLLASMNAQPFSETLVSSLGLLVWSAVFFLIGVWRFRRRYA